MRTLIGSRWNRSGYEGSLDFFNRATGNPLLTLTPGGAVFPNPHGGQDYYVDGNVVASGDGLAWNTAFKTLAEAITASNVSIALSANRWWARRNRIFVCGDQEIEEDLTVFPEKCDIIGMGTDLLPFPRIIGNHACAAATVGLRLINLGFIAKGTGDLMSFPAGCHGLQVLKCFMHPKTTSAKALEITNSAHVRIIGNEITVGAGAMANIFGVGISIEGSASIHDTIIAANRITATVGVAIVEAAAAAMGSRIEENYIRATGLAVDDNSDDFQIINNRLISDAAGDGSGGDAVVDCNLALAVGNRITCSDHVNAPFPIQGTLA